MTMELYRRKEALLESVVDALTDKDQKQLVASIINDVKLAEFYRAHTHFTLSEKQEQEAEEFYNSYVKGRNFGAVGGGMTYTITPTSIGNIVVVSTTTNGKSVKKDITDYDSW